jgi:hypothetical protein
MAPPVTPVLKAIPISPEELDILNRINPPAPMAFEAIPKPVEFVRSNATVP